MTMTARALAHETAHLPQTDRDLIGRRLVVAIELALNCPAATEQALSLKLLSFGDCPRWVCVMVARVALDLRPTGRGVAVSAAA